MVEGIQRRRWLKNSPKPSGQAKKKLKYSIGIHRQKKSNLPTSKSVASSRVLYPPPPLQQQGAEPPVLPLVVLHKVPGVLGLGGVHLHDVVVHERLGAEEREAARGAEDAAHDVLGGLLHPVADGVLEHLVPLHEA